MRIRRAVSAESWLWKVGVIFAVALGFIMAIVDVTVVNVALGRSCQHRFSHSQR